MWVKRPVAFLSPLALIAFGLILLTVIAGLMLTDVQGRANRMVVHTVRVEVALVEALERLRALEASQRGYMITGRADFLADFERARQDITRSLDEIAHLTVDNPTQVENLARLRVIADRRVAVARQTVGLMHEGRISEVTALAGSGPGPELMSEAARRIGEMSAIEKDLLVKRTRRAQYLTWLLTCGLVLAMVLVMILAGLIVAEGRKREDRLAQARDEAQRSAEAAQTALAERDVAETKLRHLQKMESIGQLTGGIAHDFNNMLAIIIGSLDLAERRLHSDPGRTARCIGDARTGAELAAKLTARLLAFSRQQPLSPRPVNVNLMVAGLHDLLARTLGENVRVEVDLAEAPWWSFVDPSQLENALLNLAVNARDAMPSGGTVTIETANVVLGEDYAAAHQEVEAGDYVLIAVGDSGKGMAPDVMERAFDPFFTTKEVGQGTGLGLSQVYGFIKQSGGHVALYSEGGAGTLVKLYLPRHEGPKPEPPVAEPARMTALPRARRGETILVVEDEDRLRGFAVDVLSELGYRVLAAGRADEALVLLEAEGAIDLLFTDVIMPGMNGRELAERAAILQPGLRVLYTTGYTRNAIVHNGVIDPGVEMLTKPFTVADLAGRIRALLDDGGEGRTSPVSGDA